MHCRASATEYHKYQARVHFYNQFNVDSSIKYLVMLCRVFGLHCIKKDVNHDLCICKDI